MSTSPTPPEFGPLDAVAVETAYEKINDLVNYMGDNLLHEQLVLDRTASGPMWRPGEQFAAEHGAAHLLRDTLHWMRQLQLRVEEAEQAIAAALPAGQGEHTESTTQHGDQS